MGGIKCPDRGDCIHGLKCLLSARCIDPFDLTADEKALLDAIFGNRFRHVFVQDPHGRIRRLASSERAHDYLMHTWPEKASSFFARRNAGVHTSVPHLRNSSPS